MCAAVEHLCDGSCFLFHSTFVVCGGEVLHEESACRMTGTRDGCCCLALPVEAACPVVEEAADGCVGIAVAADDEYLPTHVADTKVVPEVDEEALEAVLAEQLLYPCVVGVLHLVAIGSMEQVDDDEFGRVGLEGVAQKLECLVESHLGGHDAMIGVDVVFIDSRAQVERSHADMPLLGNVKVLRAGIAVAKDAQHPFETMSRCCIVCSWNGECRHIGIVGEAAHPVLSVKKR